MVGTKKTTELFSQAGQLGISKKEAIGFGGVENKAVEEGWSGTMTAVSQTENYGRESLVKSTHAPLPLVTPGSLSTSFM